MKNEDDMDPITKELWELAENTPTKFSMMKITHEGNGLTVEVDQSMDSSLGGVSQHMTEFLNEFLAIYYYWKDRKYNGEFDGKHVVRINKLLIDFGKYEGAIAWNWLNRYVKVVINLMDKEGILNLKEIEQNLNGKQVTCTEILTRVNDNG